MTIDVRDSTPAPAAPAQPAPVLDDVMLAMDVVDTIRHREELVDLELGATERETNLVARLHEIYAAQGIEVPERILRDGVKALDEQRFVYAPPKPSVAVSLAKLYIARGRWGRPVAALAGVATLLGGAWVIGVEQPRAARAEQARIELTETFPAEFARLRDSARSLATEPGAQGRANDLATDGLAAIVAGDHARARSLLDALRALDADLAAAYTVRIVSREGEQSGVWRVNDRNSNVRNFYLIVEAVDAGGNRVEVSITSEEDQKTERVTHWGLRVPQSVFERVAADKRDDEIIQNAEVGAKPRGVLTPTYRIETTGGAILDW